MRNRIAIAFGAIILVALLAWLFNANTRTSFESGKASVPPLTLLYNTEEHSDEKAILAQVIQAQLKQAGIDVILDPVPSATYNDRVGKGQFQAALTLWYLDYDDPEGFLTDFYTKASYRLSKYVNPAYDRTYLSALFAPTQEQKYAQYRAAAAVLDADLPWVPLLSNDEIFLMRHGADDFKSNSYQYYDYRRVGLEQIHAATDVEVQTLDPAQAYDLASKHLVTQSYEGLIAMNERNQIVPALATGWHFSPAGDKLTFDLRPGVRFQGCAPIDSAARRTVNSADVKASFERLVRANSPYSYVFDHVVGIEAFKARKAPAVSGFVTEGPLQFAIRLRRPFPTMLPWLLAPAAYVLPAELPAKYDFTKGSCGTGPFILTSWDGTEAKFTANRAYWLSEGGKGLPLAQTLSIRVIKDSNIQLAAFRRGELDILNVSLPLLDAVLEEDGSLKPEWKNYRYREIKLNNLQFIAFNTQSPAWGNSPALRQRLSQALDRAEIVRRLYKGKARAATNIVPTGMAGFQR